MPVKSLVWSPSGGGWLVSPSTAIRSLPQEREGCYAETLEMQKIGGMADSTASIATQFRGSTIECPICRRLLDSLNLSVSIPCYQIDNGTFVCMLNHSQEMVSGYSLSSVKTPYGFSGTCERTASKAGRCSLRCIAVQRLEHTPRGTTVARTMYG